MHADHAPRPAVPMSAKRGKRPDYWRDPAAKRLTCAPLRASAVFFAAAVGPQL